MEIYNALKEGLKGEGSDKMWCITKVLSDSIDRFVPEKEKDTILTKIYYSLHGGHFNKEFADKVMPKLYYIDLNGIKQSAPYWVESEVKPVYDSIKSKIPSEYNFWDFEVALNMIKSDNCNKLKKWFPQASKQELLDKLVEETVNYLDDEDNPFGKEKVWKYLMSDK